MAKSKLIKEVKHEADGGQKWHDEQNAALMHYRLTGDVGVYVDPTRDQEPDIAPELGVAPHPELANPAPPAASFSGRALNPDTNPMVSSVEEKEESSKEATEAFNEALAEREEKLKNLQSASDFPAGAQPVYIVEREEAKEGVPALPPDESPKAREQNPEDQLPQDLEAAGVVDAESDADSDKDSK